MRIAYFDQPNEMGYIVEALVPSASIGEMEYVRIEVDYICAPYGRGAQFLGTTQSCVLN